MGARLTMAGLAVLACTALCGCSSASPSSAASRDARPSVSPTAFYSGTARVVTPGASHSATAPPRTSASPTAPSSATPSPYPTGAPATGGGGTAGLQDPMLFGIGAAAILAGAASIAYRRRFTRGR